MRRQLAEWGGRLLADRAMNRASRWCSDVAGASCSQKDIEVILMTFDDRSQDVQWDNCSHMSFYQSQSRTQFFINDFKLSRHTGEQVKQAQEKHFRFDSEPSQPPSPEYVRRNRPIVRHYSYWTNFWTNQIQSRTHNKRLKIKIALRSFWGCPDSRNWIRRKS